MMRVYESDTERHAWSLVGQFLESNTRSLSKSRWKGFSGREVERMAYVRSRKSVAEVARPPRLSCTVLRQNAPRVGARLGLSLRE